MVGHTVFAIRHPKCVLVIPHRNSTKICPDFRPPHDPEGMKPKLESNENELIGCLRLARSIAPTYSHQDPDFYTGRTYGSK